MERKDIARKAVTAGIAAAMALSMAFTPTVALAAPGVTGQITITATSGDNANTAYSAYQIFTGDVTDSNGSKTVANIAWASNDVRTAVVNAIKAEDSSYADPTDASASAQQAAEFINLHITGTNDTTILDNASFGNKLADAVDGIAAKTTVTPGAAASLPEGYYLIVTANVNGAVDQNGTSPIFAIVGGSAVTVKEKTTVPTVEKQIKDDDAANFGKAASSELGKKLDYQITGTVASNLATYDTYYYAFKDTPSAGLDIDQSTIRVTIDGTEVAPSSYTVTAATGSLSVEFQDLKAAKGTNGAPISVSATSKVVLTYQASLNANSVIASQNNPNEVHVEYSNNPNTDEHGSTKPDKVKDYTYKLGLVKKDKQNQGRTLSGAKFTLQVKNADNTSGDNGKYVQADGSLGDTAYEFTTGNDGTISVSHIDAGTYTVKETKAPENYETISDFDVTITDNAKDMTTVDDTLTLSAASTGSQDVTTSADANTGTVTIAVSDVKNNGLPLTGQSGLMVTVLVGGAIVAASATAMAKRKKSAEK